MHRTRDRTGWDRMGQTQWTRDRRRVQKKKRKKNRRKTQQWVPGKNETNDEMQEWQQQRCNAQGTSAMLFLVEVAGRSTKPRKGKTGEQPDWLLLLMQDKLKKEKL